MTAARLRRARFTHRRGGLRDPRRRGTAYVFFLGISMIVMIIGLSALMAVRVRSRAAEDVNDGATARLCAQSAIEYTLLTMYKDSKWRDNTDHDTWQTTRETGEGTFTWKLVDETNGSLTADRSAPVRAYGMGNCGESVWVYSVLIQPPAEGLSIASNLLTNGDMETGAEAPWWETGDCKLEIKHGADEHHSGEYGMKVKGRDDPGSGPWQTITVRSDRSYRGVAWVRMKDTTDDVRLLLGVQTEAGWDWYTFAQAQVDEDWIQLAGTVTPSWSGTLISAALKVETTTRDKDFFLDDASLTQVPGLTGPSPGSWTRATQDDVGKGTVQQKGASKR